MTLASGAPVRVQLCGSLVVECAGERFEDRLPGRQGRILFAYLALNRDRPVTRAELKQAVWTPDADPSAAAGLTPLLSKLRALLGADLVQGQSTVRLALPSGSHVDVEWAEQAVHRAESQVALQNWPRAWGPSLGAILVAEREFLPGETSPWIDERRTQFADMLVRALEAYAVSTLEMGGTELPAAVRAARRLIRLAPLRETGYQVLMRALHRQGNSGDALQVYAELQTVLRDELGISPAPSSEAVFATLIGRSTRG